MHSDVGGGEAVRLAKSPGMTMTLLLLTLNPMRGRFESAEKDGAATIS